MVWVYELIDETALQLPFNLQPLKHVQVLQFLPVIRLGGDTSAKVLITIN